MLDNADNYAIFKFISYDENKLFQEIISRSAVIHDECKMVALYIQAHLEKDVHFPGLQMGSKNDTERSFLD
jgi:hypothetical protein